jgi:quinol-cytochrome oxidoreductase complex cytochrome b subunit
LTSLDLSGDNSPTPHVLVLLMAIGVVVVVVYLSFVGASTPPFISGGGGWGYKECNRVGYNMILIRTLSLLAYFTYISIGITIYTLGVRHGHLKSFE